ncbi:MAG: hypothetical protein JWO80_2720 [Bryobacterales bacterium]|nr:hypothetical protein [Bryobacterales bacterium]
MFKRFAFVTTFVAAVITLGGSGALMAQNHGNGREGSGGWESSRQGYSGRGGNYGGQGYSGRGGNHGGQAYSGRGGNYRGESYFRGQDHDRGWGDRDRYRGHDHDRGWGNGDGYRGYPRSYGYYSAPYAYGPSYYGPDYCNPGGYYDRWGNWHVTPGCSVDPLGY